MENLRLLMLKDALNVVLVNETVLQWQSSSKSGKDVGVCGMLEPDLKILKIIAVVARTFYFLLFLFMICLVETLLMVN
jgi:hypothetical protein